MEGKEQIKNKTWELANRIGKGFKNKPRGTPLVVIIKTRSETSGGLGKD